MNSKLVAVRGAILLSQDPHNSRSALSSNRSSHVGGQYPLRCSHFCNIWMGSDPWMWSDPVNVDTVVAVRFGKRFQVDGFKSGIWFQVDGNSLKIVLTP